MTNIYWLQFSSELDQRVFGFPAARAFRVQRAFETRLSTSVRSEPRGNEAHIFKTSLHGNLNTRRHNFRKTNFRKTRRRPSSCVCTFHPAFIRVSIRSHPVPSCAIRFHPVPSYAIRFHPLPSGSIRFHPVPSGFPCQSSKYSFLPSSLQAQSRFGHQIGVHRLFLAAH